MGRLIDSGEAELKTGPFGTQLKASEYQGHGTPVVNVKNIGFGSVREDKLEFISENTRDRLSSHLLEVGDIVFGRKGAVERHFFVQQPQKGWIQGSDCLRLRFHSSRVIPRFVSYYLLTAEHQRWMLNHCSHGATMPSLNQEILERIEFPLPPLSSQTRIVELLSAYDDLIENCQRRIQILETMSRAVYREWFVHFRFPGHKTTPKIDSELGKIPGNWEIGPLDDLIVLQRGFDLPQSSRKEGNIPIIAASGPSGFHNEAKVKAPGIVTGRSGSLGTVSYIHEDFWPLNTTLWAKAFPKSEPLFAYFALSSLDLSSFNSGAAVPTLNRNDIHALRSLIPPRRLQRDFQATVQPIVSQIRTLERTIEILRRTRDLLLPRLMSGEIDVEALAP